MLYSCFHESVIIDTVFSTQKDYVIVSIVSKMQKGHHEVYMSDFIGKDRRQHHCSDCLQERGVGKGSGCCSSRGGWTQSVGNRAWALSVGNRGWEWFVGKRSWARSVGNRGWEWSVGNRGWAWSVGNRGWKQFSQRLGTICKQQRLGTICC